MLNSKIQCSPGQLSVAVIVKILFFLNIISILVFGQSYCIPVDIRVNA